MVGKTGFEPATPWSQTKCSTKLSHFPIYGALEGIRTPDLLVRSQTLYPTELRAQDILFSYSTLVVLILFIKMVAPAGIEPATQGFSVPCSTD